MNKKGQAGFIIPLSITLILGVIVLTVIFSIISQQTTTTVVVNDTFAAVNNTCVRVTQECMQPNTAKSFFNVSNAAPIGAANFSECGDGSDTFGIKLNENPGNSISGGNVNVSYSGRSCGFIEGGLTVLVVNNYAILLAIALIVFLGAFLIVR